MAALKKNFARSRDDMAVRYRQDHPSIELPPIWIASQVVTFGVLSRCIGHLAKKHDRQQIAKPFGLEEQYFCSFLHLATYPRNICAHHERLWDRQIDFELKLSRLAVSDYGSFQEGNLCSFYNTLATADIVLSQTHPEYGLCGRVARLLQGYPDVDTKMMGFPDGWQDTPGWKSALGGSGQAR